METTISNYFTVYFARNHRRRILKAFGHVNIGPIITEYLGEFDECLGKRASHIKQIRAPHYGRVASTVKVTSDVHATLVELAARYSATKTVIVRNLVLFACDLKEKAGPVTDDSAPADVSTVVDSDVHCRLLESIGSFLLNPHNTSQLLEDITNVLSDQVSTTTPSPDVPTKALTVPPVNRILADLEGKGWVPRSSLVNHYAGPKSKGRQNSGLAGGLSVRLRGMATAGDLDRKEENDEEWFRIAVPDPLTDEASILNVLQVQAQGDWVNESYMFRCLHLLNADDDTRMLAKGRIYSLISNGQIDSRVNKGETQWQSKSPQEEGNSTNDSD